MATDSLADEIRHKLGDLSPGERKVARVLLSNYPAAGFETLAVLATRASVSAPTVLRFVTRLGYPGFPDFQAALREELDHRTASPLTLYADSRPPAKGLLRTAHDLLTAGITRTFAELPPHDVEQAVALLGDAKRRITLCGGRFTHLFAHYLGLHLTQLRDDVRFLPDREVERASLLAGIRRRDVLVVFDYRRYEPDKVALAEHVTARGGSVVLFTDPWISPVAGLATVVLTHQVSSPSPYDSLVPTLATVETLITGLLTALGDAGHRTMQSREDTAARLHLY